MQTSYRKFSSIASRLFIDFARNFHDELSLSADESVLSAALYIGMLEDKPMTASKLSEYTFTPRATIIRKLELLERAGTAVRDRGKRWRLNFKNEIMRANMKSIARKNIRLIRKASTELSKLDSATIAAPTRHA